MKLEEELVQPYFSVQQNIHLRFTEVYIQVMSTAYPTLILETKPYYQVPAQGTGEQFQTTHWIWLWFDERLYQLQGFRKSISTPLKSNTFSDIMVSEHEVESSDICTNHSNIFYRFPDSKPEVLPKLPDQAQPRKKQYRHGTFHWKREHTMACPPLSRTTPWFKIQFKIDWASFKLLRWGISHSSEGVRISSVLKKPTSMNP